MIYLITLGFVALAFLGIGIGAIFANKPVKGTCSSVAKATGSSAECSCTPAERFECKQREKKEVRSALKGLIKAKV